MIILREYMRVSLVCALGGFVLSACFAVPTAPTIPAGKFSARIEIADRYCADVGIRLDNHRALTTLRTSALIGLGAGAVLGVGGGVLFINEGQKDSPSTGALEDRGYAGLAGTTLVAIASALYLYANKAIDSRRASSTKVAAVRALTETMLADLDALQEPEDSEDRKLPGAYVANCRKIADEQESQSLADTTELVKDLSNRLKNEKMRTQDERARSAQLAGQLGAATASIALLKMSSSPRRSAILPKDCPAIMNDLLKKIDSCKIEFTDENVATVCRVGTARMQGLISLTSCEALKSECATIR
jgi:hypothetical protein